LNISVVFFVSSVPVQQLQTLLPTKLMQMSTFVSTILCIHTAFFLFNLIFCIICVIFIPWGRYTSSPQGRRYYLFCC